MLKLPMIFGRDEQKHPREEQGGVFGGGREWTGRKESAQSQARQRSRAKRGLSCKDLGRPTERFGGAVGVTGIALDGGKGHSQDGDVG